MSVLKKLHYTIATGVSLSLIVLYMLKPLSLEKFNNNFIDIFFNLRGEMQGDENIIIVDIDEKSVQEKGQWPWKREILATLVDQLNANEVGVIGYDIVFAEEDDRSPLKILQELNVSLQNIKDYDQIFSQSIANSPSVLGFAFNFEQNYTNQAPFVNALFIEENKEGESSIPIATGVTSNLEIFEKNALSSGSFNMFPDSDGVVRFVPMLFSYDEALYPSLSLELIRLALGEQMVRIQYDENGIENLVLGDVVIPTDAKGRLFINFAGGRDSYQYIRALDILEGKIKKEALSGKIVLIGTSAAGLFDMRATPFDEVMPGVEIHANVIDNIINDNLLQNPSYAIAIDWALIIGVTFLTMFLMRFASPFVSLLAVIFLMLVMEYGLYFLMFEEKLVVNFLFPTMSLTLTTLILFITNLVIASKQKEQILSKFSKKVSPAVADALIKSKNVDFTAESKEVTIFFSDVRDFTAISEQISDAKILIGYLNQYMAPMSDIIITHKGTIDKYIGDAIMAYWNAPIDVEYHADKAVTAALKQIEALMDVNKSLVQDGFPEIRIGIGLHSGEAVVGEMGSSDRSDYTIIGDNVNLASRIEGLCKQYGAKILISEQTKALLKNEYKIREVDIVQVKGRAQSVTLFEVLGFGSFNEKEAKEYERFLLGLQYYRESNFSVAREIFGSLKKDALHMLYFKRCKEFLDQDIRLKDGVFKYETK